MKLIKMSSCLVIISILLLSSNSLYVKEIIADPLAPFVPSIGGILLPDNNSYFMPYANVLVEIDATNPISHFNLFFKGNYTIYNPNNSTDVTIVAPFSPYVFGMDFATVMEILSGNGTSSGPVQIEMPEVISNCTIKINNSVIPFDIFIYNPVYGYEYSSLFMIYLLCNISLPKNSTSELEYNFYTYLATPSRYDYYEIQFEYYVGTSRTWCGNIAEKVEFRVKGNQPDRVHSVRLEPNLTTFHNYTISDIKNGKSYLWEWYNVRIFEDFITLRYDNNFKDSTISFGIWILTFSLIGIAITITLQKFKLDLKRSI